MTHLLRLRMLDTSLAILEDQVKAMRGWTMTEMEDDEEAAAHSLEGIDVDDLFDSMDTALEVFADTRNKYAEERGMTVHELSLHFTSATYDDKASMDEER